MLKRLLLAVALLFGTASYAQTFQVSGTVKDSNGTLYQNGSGRIVIVTPGNQQPTVNGSAIQSVYPISSLGSFATFSLPLYSNFAISPAGSQYTLSFCDQTAQFCFTTTPITISSQVDLTNFIQPQAAILPTTPGGGVLSVNGTHITNPNFINSATVSWSFVGSQIQATVISVGGQNFATISTGVNTQATMTVGTGASLLTSGTGTIAATSVPFSGVLSGTNVSASLVVASGSSLTFSGTGLINASRINGTSVPVNSVADQALITSAPATGLWSSLPLCLDTAGQHLNYNTSAHMFTCGTSGGTAGSAAFNTITSGTNTQAAMVVGTGASLSVSGSGTIAATSSPFAGLTSGTNATAAMVIGTGASLTISGSGTNNANLITGTTVPTNSAADQYLGTTASATGQWASMPDCLDSGGNHLNYNTGTHAFSCGTSGGSAGSAAFNTITSGTNTQAAMLVGTGASLAATGTGTITATGMPFGGLTTDTNTTATLTIGTGASLTTSGTGIINANEISSTTIPINSAADQVLLTTAAAVGSWGPVPPCLDTSGQHLNYNTSIHAFACGTTSSGGGGGGSPGGNEGEVQLKSGSTFGAVTGLKVDSVSVPTTFIVPLDSQFKGADPYYDIRFSGARGVVIHTTGTGSGTSINVGVSSFVNGNGITILGGGPAPSITTPAGLTVSPGLAAGMTTADVPTANTSGGGTTYQYRIFAHDILGGATAPTGTVTTTTGASTLGENQVPISTWSLLGATLTITTTVPNGFVKDAEVHTTGTSNNQLAEGWYPISSITNSTTFVINNVPQWAPTTVSGTGGLATVFTGNALTWTASTGGTLGTTNTAWDYFVCAQRPGDGAFHIVGRSFPASFYGENYISTRFVDFGPVLSANPIVPWYLSDANCTAVAAQNQLAITTVASGGGTLNLTLASPLTSSVTGTAVRLDNALPIGFTNGAALNTGSIYIPAGQSFETNSFVNLAEVDVWQAGTIVANDTIIVQGSVNWSGKSGIGGAAQQFAFNSAPIVTCNAYPCVYDGRIAGQGNGGNTFTNLNFVNPNANGLLMLVDSGWGQIWDRVVFKSGSNNNDNMGIDLMIRPGASGYKIRNSTFTGGPTQITDQTWAPLVYLDQCPSTCSFGGAGVGTVDIDNIQVNRRGIYEITNGGSGIITSIHGLYRQGGITPIYTLQNINGNIQGEVDMEYLNHDTENEASYAWICNLNCSGGFGVPTHLGFVDSASQDAGSIPAQLTGGGNQPIGQIVSAMGAGGVPVGTFNIPFGQGWMILNGHLTPTIPVGFNTGIFPGADISPNVPTPAVCLESSTFCGTLQTVVSLTANRTYTFPDASGIVCLTSTCGGQFYQTIQVNGVAQTQEPTANYVAGTNMTITPTTVGGVTTLTFISSSSASTAWASITAGTNSNAGTFTATGNTWNFSGASGFSLPSGTTIPGSGSGQVSLVTQAAAGTPTITFGTSSGTPAVTASSPLAITTATGNILCATCATTTNGGALTGTLPISISAAGAISVANATTGAVGVIELAGNLGGTATSPTVVSTTITGFTVNTLVKFDSGGNLINTALVEASSLLTIAENVDLQANAQISEIANNGATGTTIHKLASLTAAPSKAIITTAASTSGSVGIVVGGAGTTGSAQVAVDGQATCVYDGGTTAGDYVQISASVNGDCTDAGATPPSSGQVIGLVLSTNASGGTYNTFLFGPGAAAGGGGGGSGTVNACASFATSPISFYSASTAITCDANITVSAGSMTLGIAGSTAGSLILSGSASGAISLKTQAAAGTFNWNYPITAGTSTFFLTSAGGGSSPMTWTSPVTTINGVSCTVGSTCTTLTLNTLGVANGSQVLLNFVASTSNTVGLTNTPVNSGTSQEQFQITGTVNASGGGTGVSNPTAHSLLVAEGAANMNLITSPSTNGNYICGFNVIASSAVDPTCNLTGVPVLTPATPYTGLYSDRATVQLLSGGSTFSWTAPQITGNTAANFPVLFLNKNSGVLTFTANAADKVNGGALGGTYATPTLWATFMYQDNSSAPGNWWPLTIPDLSAFPASCADTGGNHLNIVSGVFTCGTSSLAGGGTVTTVNTTGPISGGPITTTGSIACASCVFSLAPLANTAIVVGVSGAQGSGTDASATLVAGALTLSGGGSVTLGGSSSGTFAITVDSTAANLSFGSNASISSAGVLTVVSCSGCAAAAVTLSSVTAATGANTIANGDNAQVWNWALTTASKTAFKFGETSTATGSGDILIAMTTTLGSTAIPLVVTNSLNGSQVLPTLKIASTWNTSGVVDAALLITVTNTASGSGALLIDAQVGGTSQFKVDKGGNVTALGLLTGSSLSVSGAAAMGQFNLAETTAPSGASSTDICYGDSTLHGIKCSFNNGVFAGIPQYNAFAALTDGATVTWAIGSVAQDNKTLTFTTHGGSRTLNITNPVNGGSYVLWLKQDATGGEGLILGTGCTWKVSGGGAGAISPSTGAAAIDVLAFTYDGTNCYANFNKNFN